MAEPEEAEANKTKYKKDKINVKIIIVDSIKANLIPQESLRRTPKEMFDALYGLFEGRNINIKMTLRNHLKRVRPQNNSPQRNSWR